MYNQFKLIICESPESYTLKGKVENQHDKLFKKLLKNEEELKNFLYEYLKLDIRKKEIEQCTNSYITKHYQSYEADIVYKVKNENKYILIEHQSSIDERMPYRVLNYATEIIKEEIANKDIRNQKYQYPLIIPIVLYTGGKKWKVKRKFSEKVENSNNGEKYIEMKYELIDINDYSEQELLEKKTAISYAMLIEKNKGKDSLMNILNKIVKNCTNEETSEKMQNIIQYLLYPILGEDTEEMIKKFKKKEGMNMKTAQDYIREEINQMKKEEREKGREEGKILAMKTAQDYIREEINQMKKEEREKGREENQKIIILNMLKSKLEISKIREYTGIEEEEIQKIALGM